MKVLHVRLKYNNIASERKVFNLRVGAKTRNGKTNTSPRAGHDGWPELWETICQAQYRPSPSARSTPSRATALRASFFLTRSHTFSLYAVCVYVLAGTPEVYIPHIRTCEFSTHNCRNIGAAYILVHVPLSTNSSTIVQTLVLPPSTSIRIPSVCIKTETENVRLILLAFQSHL